MYVCMCGGGGDNLVAIWSLQTMIFLFPNLFLLACENRRDNEGNEKGFCLFHDGIALALVNWQWLLIDAQFRGLMAQMSLSPLRLGLIEIWKGQRLQRMWCELLTTLL